MQQVVQSFYNWYSQQIAHPQYRWLIILGTFIYLFSPINLSSNLFPIVGWLDDAVILTLLTTELSKLVLNYRKDRRPSQQEDQPQTPQVVEIDAEEVSSRV